MNFFNFNKKKTEKQITKPSLEKYLDHLDNIFQTEPEFYKNESLIEGVYGVTSIVYKDIPEKGYITAFTFGLSLIEHSEWKFGRPELCITVESSNIDWGQIVGFIANKLRGDCPFCYGDTINFRERIREASEMDAFFVFARSILDNEDYLNIDIGADYKINIAGLYPMYSEEIDIFQKIGLKEFWHHPNFDNYNVKRRKITT